MTEEDELKERYRALRRFDAARVPEFKSILARDRSDRGAAGASFFERWRRPGLVLALSAAAGFFLWSGRDVPVRQDGEWTAGQWATPTDVLLDLSTIPGNRLLHEVPSFAPPPLEVPDGAHHPTTDRRIRT